MKRIFALFFSATVCLSLFAQDGFASNDDMTIETEGVSIVTVCQSDFSSEYEAMPIQNEDTFNQSSSSGSGYIPPFPFSPNSELRDFCPSSYSYLRTWNTLRWIGIPCMAVGLVGCLVGGVLFSSNPSVGAALLGVGVPCAVAVIPLACVSSYKKRQAKAEYDKCVMNRNTALNRRAVNLNFQSTSDGIGLALKF